MKKNYYNTANQVFKTALNSMGTSRE